MKKYTVKELAELTNYSTARLAQFRTGAYSPTTGKRIPPLIVEGTDWQWERGGVVYFESAVKKITAYSNGK